MRIATRTHPAVVHSSQVAAMTAVGVSRMTSGLSIEGDDRRRHRIQRARRLLAQQDRADRQRPQSARDGDACADQRLADDPRRGLPERHRGYPETRVMAGCGARRIVTVYRPFSALRPTRTAIANITSAVAIGW